ncbi:MAG: 30S ribosomal protein S16 [Clostridia bacterium]|nr:30S ribosomal protein S16 [Clostridia bacterium]MCL6521635.1 30S ribosomal protein S16 [Bacillota bacterium]
MAVKIRLRRMGAKHHPFYRVVVADSRSPRDGRFIESIGYYDPTAEPAVSKIDAEKAVAWLRRGAQPTETVRALFRRHGIFGLAEARSSGEAPSADGAEEERDGAAGARD